MLTAYGCPRIARAYVRSWAWRKSLSSTSTRADLPLPQATFTASRVHAPGPGPARDAFAPFEEGREKRIAHLLPGEILVQNHVAGLNFIDTYHRSGLYSTAEWSERQPPGGPGFIPGVEGAGTVIFSNSSSFQEGDRVAYYADSGGSYATETVVAAASAAIVPDGVSLESAAALTVQGATAHYLACSCYFGRSVGPGDVAVVHAAAGGTGALLTQIASSLGATVVATASTEEKRSAALSSGATLALPYGDDAGGSRVLSLLVVRLDLSIHPNSTFQMPLTLVIISLSLSPSLSASLSRLVCHQRLRSRSSVEHTSFSTASASQRSTRR